MNAKEILGKIFGEEMADASETIDWENIAALYKGPNNLIENKQGSQFLEKFIDSDMINVDIDKRVIIMKKFSYFRALTYLPSIYPELECMDTDDNFKVYTLDTGELKEVALLRFKGKNMSEFTLTGSKDDYSTSVQPNTKEGLIDEQKNQEET